MEGLFSLIIIIVLVFAVSKRKQTSKKGQGRSVPPVPPIVKKSVNPWEELFDTGKTEGTAPSDEEAVRDFWKQYEMQETPARAADSHHHVEQAATEADTYAGEGDEARYLEREVSCETAGHTETPSPAPRLRTPDREGLANAVIWSEILGKPKALR